MHDYSVDEIAINLTFSDSAPIELACMPEFVANNVVDLLLFLRRFKMSFYEVDSQ